MVVVMFVAKAATAVAVAVPVTATIFFCKKHLKNIGSTPQDSSHHQDDMTFVVRK